MELHKHEQFIAANRKLMEFRRRVEAFANDSSTVTETELETIMERLLDLTPKVGDASRSEALDRQLLDGIAEYVRNFRAVQQAVEKIHRNAMGRNAELEVANGHLGRMEGWNHNYQ
jgi:hypothetical protein